MLRRCNSLAIQLRSPATASAAPWRARCASSSAAVTLAFRPALQPGDSRESADLKAAPPDSDAAKLARLEAVLLAAREPLSSRKLARFADLADGTEARTLVRQLERRLRARGSAMTPVEIAGGVQLLTRPELAGWLIRSAGSPDDLRLSPAALETLAVVAYQQPVTRAAIEAVRGVQCGEMLRVLMERDLLRIVGRSAELGRPILYGTTRKFLQVFGLRRLEQLPPIDQIRSA